MRRPKGQMTTLQSLVSAGTLVLGCILALPSARASEEADGRDRFALAPASDTETSSGFGVRPLQLVAGKITQLTAKECIVEREDQPTLTIPSDRIVWIQPAWSQEQAVSGFDAIAQRQWNEAIRQLAAAVEQSRSAWRQMWMSLRLVRAALEAQRYRPAFIVLGQLDHQRLAAPTLVALPLTWQNVQINRALMAEATEQLDSRRPLVRLLAASLLLSGPQSTAAARTLEELAQDRSVPMLAGLAEAQLWRRLTPVELQEQLAGIKTKLASFPPALLPGPQLAIADRLLAAGRREEALEFALAVAWLTPDRDLQMVSAAEAMAVDLLRQLDRVPEAEALEAALAKRRNGRGPVATP